MLKRWSLPLALLTVLALPVLAMASEGHPSIPGAELSAVWVIPFVCMLLSIAIMPLALPHIWHHHFGKISVFWGLAFLIPCLVVYGFNVAFYEFLHAILLEYIPFIVLLFALFTVAGGVRLKGSLVGTPVVNTGILAVGTILASWMGTTGAAMLLIRPLLRANAHRKYRVHSVVFFIFLVANIGGSLTPLGDPPLFLGYLKGVSFFWTTTNLFVKTCFMSLALLGLDQWVKHYVTVNIPLGEAQPFLPGLVELRTVHNYGAAWSSFSGMRWLLVAVTSVIVIAVAVVLLRRIVRHPLGVAAGFLILSGGVGNIIDRVRLGYVVDMFHLEFWPSYPVFNVADICVVCGAVLAVIYYLWFYDKYDKRGKAHGDADAPSES